MVLRADLEFQLVLQYFLLFMIHTGVNSTHCPPSCKCVFDDNLTDNFAKCQVGNSTISITWKEIIVHKVLTISCKGTQFTCSDLPQFNVIDGRAYLEVDACAPSIMECINGIYRQPSAVIKAEIRNLTGQYEGDDFSRLNKLNTMTLYLTDADKELPAAAINSLPSISKVTIVGGDFKLQSNIFKQSRLKYLQLESNNVTDIPDDAFNGLAKLTKLRLKNNIEIISPNAFRGLDALLYLYIKDLRIHYLNPEVFLTTAKLDFLSLYNTELHSLKKGFMDVFKKLEKLQITGNEVEMILDSEALAHLPYWIYNIELSDCKIRSLPENVFNRSKHLRSITMDKNLIDILPPKVFCDLISLKDINYQNNSIKVLPEGIFSQIKKIVTLDFSYNSIETLSGEIFPMNAELLLLLLNNNQINYIDLNVFKGLNIRNLDLSANKIQRIIEENSLNWQTKKMNLSRNELSLFEDWFVKFDDLIELDLAYNKIKTIKESHIYSFNSRVELDLRNNKISHVIRDNTNPKLLAPNSNITIYLANNPLECDCLVTTVLNDWNKHGILADFEDIICFNGDVVSKLNIYLLCNKTHAFIGLVGMSIIGSLILIVLIISLYAQKTKILDCIWSVFNRSTVDLTLYEIKQDSLKLYDLFVSFAHQDAEFVVDNLLPKFENDFNQNVCVHYRDWVVGDLIPDQIIQSVDGSRMTVIILSEHFLVSEWSYLEFRTAHNLSIQEGKPKVIIILLDENILQHANLSDDLKSYIAVNTYLLWGDPNFWEKLQKVLPRQGKLSHKK